MSDPDPGTTQVAERAIAEADALARAGQTARAVEHLATIERTRRDAAIEGRLVQLRHDAMTVGATPTPTPAGEWPVPAPDRFPEPGIPEVHAADLDVDVVRAALANRGALLVRGLLDGETASLLRADIDRAFEAAEQADAGRPITETAPWYVPFEANEGYSFGRLERSFTHSLGGVLSVESPRSLSDVIEAFKAVGLGDLLRDYFGEWPAISAKKSTLRRARPDAPTEWHQDGAFLGSATRTLNVWTALTPCGVDAPGLDVIPRAFDHIVPTGTDDALFSWSVSPEQAVREGGADAVSPVFEAGDALLFNQMTLHRTGVRPGMTETRYAIESWFFAPSTYPHEQVPILF